MRNGRWTGSMAGATFCLAAAACSLLAAPASQPAGQAGSASTDEDFRLDTSDYPPGVASLAQYKEYLATGLRDRETRLKRAGSGPEQLAAALDLASFALIQAAEPALSRAWLWGASGEKSDRAVYALAVAGRALQEADKARRPIDSKAAGEAADRTEVLSALLAMETVLLGHPGHRDAGLQAAQQADAAANKVPQGAQPGWDLLVAGCLLVDGRTQDADLRRQRVLRQHPGTSASLAALLLQSASLGQTGNFAAGVALISEYLQAINDNDRVARSTLLLVKANRLGAWAAKTSQSKSDLDRRTAEDLRKQAEIWRTRAKDSGPDVLRLRSILRTLEMEQP